MSGIRSEPEESALALLSGCRVVEGTQPIHGSGYARMGRW